MTRARSLGSSRVALWLCALLASFGCTETHERPATAVLVAIDAEDMVRAGTDSLRVEIASGPTREALEVRKTEQFDFPKSKWPATLTLVPKDERSQLFQILARAQRDGRDVAEIRVISGFVPRESLLLEVTFKDACIDVLDCKDDQTCVVEEEDASCGTAVLDKSKLKPLSDKDIDRLGGQNDQDGGADVEPDAETPNAGKGGSMNAGRGGSQSMAGTDEPPPVDAGSDAAPNDGGSDDGAVEDDGSVEPPPPEDCFNSVDDDGDRRIDCDDRDCDPTAVCVPEGDDYVVLLRDENGACAQPYGTGAVTVHSGLSTTNTCNGCGCSATQADVCTADVYFYASMDECIADTSLIGGSYVGQANATCTGMPIGQNENMYTPQGWRTGIIFPAVPATCEPSGNPRPDTPSWAESRKLCLADAPSIGAGCNSGYVCMPRSDDEDAAEHCSVHPEGSGCNVGDGADWYRGVVDQRSCTACQCDVIGGDCSEAYARLGTDYTCSQSEASWLYEVQQDCAANNYSPPVDVAGVPTIASCDSSATVTGPITPIEGVHLCCASE